MNKKILLSLLVLMLAHPLYAGADEAVTSTESTVTTEPAVPENEARLKEKYNLTDEQMKALKDSKLPAAQYSMVAALSKESGKSIEDILKMRTEQKMGWGKIAKELGVPPKTLGQSVADMHRQDGEARERREDKKEMREERKQMREARKEARANRKEKKDH